MFRIGLEIIKRSYLAKDMIAEREALPSIRKRKLSARDIFQEEFLKGGLVHCNMSVYELHVNCFDMNLCFNMV